MAGLSVGSECLGLLDVISTARVKQGWQYRTLPALVRLPSGSIGLRLHRSVIDADIVDRANNECQDQYEGPALGEPSGIVHFISLPIQKRFPNAPGSHPRQACKGDTKGLQAQAHSPSNRLTCHWPGSPAQRIHKSEQVPIGCG
jgi:hypothetical protein